MILDFSRRSLNSLVSVATCQGSAKSPKEKHFTKKTQFLISYSISNPTVKLDNNCFVLVIFFECDVMIRRIFCGVYRLEICLVRPASRGAKQRNLNEDKTWAKYFYRWQQVKICPNIRARFCTKLHAVSAKHFQPILTSFMFQHVKLSNRDNNERYIKHPVELFSSFSWGKTFIWKHCFLLVNASVRVDWKVHCCTLSQTWSGSSNWIKVNPELFVNF